ncbi:interleukin-9 receptor-like [Oryx dammah]|uniref:interleukin-9 receptor-like n=1 Tax=Oryx dammah TaxID=59534 RepID=UPI001A9A8EC5|nr:interleukin-9 receptor-like [Oryx dammah]
MAGQEAGRQALGWWSSGQTLTPRPGRKRGWDKGPECCVLKAVSTAQWEGTSRVGMSARPLQDGPAGPLSRGAPSCVVATPRLVSSGCDWASLGPSWRFFLPHILNVPCPPHPKCPLPPHILVPASRPRHPGGTWGPGSERCLLDRPGHMADSDPGGLSLSSCGCRSPAVFGLLHGSEVLMREAGTCFLLCACVCAWLSLGVPVLGDRGGRRAGAEGRELGGRGPLVPTCVLSSNVVPGSKHKCVFWADVCTVELPPEEVLVPADNFTITFHRHISGKEQVSLVDPQYLPRRHVKLDPPSDLQSNVSSEHCVLTWSVNPALEPLAMLLSYELAFKRQEEAWEWARHKDHIVGVTWLKLEAAELDPGSAYEARLRVQMASLEGEVAEEERYEGVWSDWSQPACFAAPHRRGRLVPALGQSNSTLVAVSLFLLLSSLTYLLFKLSPRMKTALYQDVPSPGPFFQPLYSVHNGDFQTWIGARRASPQAGRDHAGPPRGALLEARVREAVALLHCDPADAWPSAGLEEEGSPGPGLPADVLPTEHVEWGEPSPTYLPQEDWAPAGCPRPMPPQCEGSSGDYCALDCSAGS